MKSSNFFNRLLIVFCFLIFVIGSFTLSLFIYSKSVFASNLSFHMTSGMTPHIHCDQMNLQNVTNHQHFSEPLVEHPSVDSKEDSHEMDSSNDLRITSFFTTYGNLSEMHELHYQKTKITSSLDRFMDLPLIHSLSVQPFSSIISDEARAFFGEKTLPLLNKLSIDLLQEQQIRPKPTSYQGKPFLLVIATSFMFDSYDDNNIRYLIQKYAIRSMLYLQTHYPIQFVVFNKDPTSIQYAKLFDFPYCNDYEVNEMDIPFVGNMFRYIESHFDSEFYGYINSDNILSSTIFDVLVGIKKNIDRGVLSHNVYLAGRRYNIQFDEYIQARGYLKYYDLISKYFRETRKPYNEWSMDYFITTPGILSRRDLAPVVIGRNYVDSYLLTYVNYVKELGVDSIDCSDVVTSIHMSFIDRRKFKREKKDKYYNWEYYYNMTHSIYVTSLNDTKYILRSKPDGELDFLPNTRKKLVIKPAKKESK